MPDFECLRELSKNVHRDLKDITHSSKFYVTPEICTEIRDIRNGIDHLNLDHNLLENSRWNNLCNPKYTARHRNESTDLMCAITDQVYEIKDRMEVNKIRKELDYNAQLSHYMTMQDFYNIEKVMEPLTRDSVNRLEEYCNDVGVTDRFTTYRNNLNRGSLSATRQKYSWLTKPAVKTDYVPSCKNSAAYDINLCRQKIIDKETMLSDNTEKNVEKEEIFQRCGFSAPPVPLSIQEECGINVQFPGDSEYTNRFKEPNRRKSLPNYTLNPSPDYRMDGRLLAPIKSVPMLSDYLDNFVWPDDRKLKIFPWLKK